MRAVNYGRVSTDEQAKEGYSIDSQGDYCLKFIQSQDWELFDSYVDDGYSAKDLNRPAMRRLIKDAKARKFEVVVFYKLDRLVRSVSDLDKLLKIFDANSIAIRSVTEPFDTTTAIGRFLITLVAAIAQWERETISERVVVNMTKKATLGERNGGRAPFGYRLVDGKLEIFEEEAKHIREMFRLYIKGNGIRSLAIYLHRFGIDKDIRTVGRMLDNPVYSGKLRWANNSNMDVMIVDTEDIPAILDEETFALAQDKRNQNRKEGKKATSPYPFSGVLKCARCGSALSGYYKKARGTKHYLCITKKNKGTCDLPQFTEAALTQTFLDQLTADDPAEFLKLSQDFHIEQKENDDQEHLVKQLEKELSAIKTRKRNWLLALGNGVISQEEYLSMTADDTKKEEMIKEQLAELSTHEVSLDRESILSMLRFIPKLWEIASDLEKKNFIYDLFESITVDVPSSYYRAPGKTPTVEIKGVKFV
jgi:site-specific DNA recombinase